MQPAVPELTDLKLQPQYHAVSKIFWTGDTIYTSIVVARCTGSKRPNCYVRVLLRGFAATAWKRAKMPPHILVRTDLAASPWQRPVWHFRPYPEVSGVILNGYHPPPTVLPLFDILWLLTVSKNEIEAERTPVYTIEEIQAELQRVLDTDRKGLPGSVPKMKETVGPASTCGRELLQGWWRPIGLMMSFMFFIASVRNILDTPS
jgi:hypothetical protein